MAIGWTLFAKRAASVILFRCVRLVFTTVQRIYWELNGTASQLRDAVDSRHYERTAHVLDVVLEHHFCENQTHCLGKFLCVHNRFENPQFVIDNEHVTLLTITPTNAVFGVAREKGNCSICLDLCSVVVLETMVLVSRLLEHIN